MAEIKNVIVLGASGNIGRPILDALVAAGRFSVVCFLTRLPIHSAYGMR